MSSKNCTDVLIDGKIYTLSGYESEDYLQKVASYINNKVAEYKKEDGFRKQSLDVQRTLLELNIADDYYKAKKQVEHLESELENKEKQLYDLKHELIAAQIKIDALEKENKTIQKEMNDYEKKIVRFETELIEKKRS